MDLSEINLNRVLKKNKNGFILKGKNTGFRNYAAFLWLNWYFTQRELHNSYTCLSFDWLVVFFRRTDSREVMWQRESLHEWFLKYFHTNIHIKYLKRKNTPKDYKDSYFITLLQPMLEVVNVAVQTVIHIHIQGLNM